MPLHIKDPDATAAVRQLAQARKVSLTEAVRSACQEAIERDGKARPISERLADIHAQVRATRKQGAIGEAVDDKAFFDAEWERGL